MNGDETRPAPATAGGPPRELLDVRPVLVVLAVLVAYARSCSVPWLFDDGLYVLLTPQLRDLTDPLAYLTMPTTRPVVFLTLALNWGLSADEPYSYHALNLLIHLVGALSLYGIVRRTLRLPGSSPSRVANAGSAALLAALWWALHPVQTQAVAYVWQRCESLMGMFYLLTLYTFLRGATAARGGGWYVACVASCALGMGSKEVMVTAPLLVLLYDRCFLSGSFAAALRRRLPLHGGLAACWGLLALLLAHGAEEFHNHPGIGFGAAQGDTLAYLLTAPGLLVHYLSLAIWPAGLCFDYAWPLARRPAEILVPLLALAPALALTAWALARRPRAGFVGAAFFLALGPTCSVMPMPDPMVEYRLYLPLAALASLASLTLYRGLQRWPNAALLSGLALSAMLGWLTVRRVETYQSEAALWLEALSVSPDNPRAYHNLFLESPTWDALERAHEAEPNAPGYRMIMAYHLSGGEQRLRDLLRDEPDLAVARLALAQMLEERGELDEALLHLRAAQAKFPWHPGVNLTLARVLHVRGDLDGAEQGYRRALSRFANSPRINLQLGALLWAQGRTWEALPPLTSARHVVPDVSKGAAVFLALSDEDRVAASYLLGACLARTGGRLELARLELERGRELLSGLEGTRAFAADAPLFSLRPARGGSWALTGLFEAQLGMRGLSARLAWELGRVHEAQGDLERAAEAYRETLLHEPAHAQARQRLAVLSAAKATYPGKE